MRSQICLQPLLLRRARTTATHLTTIRVERDEMPSADIIAVIACGGIARCGAEVIVVTARASRQIFMVSNDRMNDVFNATPTGIEGLLVFRQCSILILCIA